MGVGAVGATDVTVDPVGLALVANLSDPLLALFKGAEMRFHAALVRHVSICHARAIGTVPVFHDTEAIANARYYRINYPR